MRKEWYVLHTLTGQEMKVKQSIERRLKHAELEEYIERVVVPMEKVQDVRRGVKVTLMRKFFPGYVLIKMALYDDNNKIIDKCWRFIKETNGVIGFAGGEKPASLNQEEAEEILKQLEAHEQIVKPKMDFKVGETIRITNGPFMNFNGVIDEVIPAKGRIKVSVTIFGRTVPVELEYWQVERV